MPKISLFCETRNPLKWEYPAKEFIEYHAPFVDEIIVCDAGSDDGWREYLKSISKVKVVDFRTQKIFTQFGQAGLQKAVAREYCHYPYILHVDIDTFLIGIDKIQSLISQYPDVDDFPVRILNFYGSFSKINKTFEGSDPYQHTLMKNRPEIGVGRSWDGSDGAEFIYVENRQEYLACLRGKVFVGKYIRECSLRVKNIPETFSYEEHEFALYHYGWCCRSFETMKRKALKQQHAQTSVKEGEKTGEHVFLLENDPQLVDFHGEHPVIIQDLMKRVGADWRFK